jgi:hypothetical protein
LRGLLAAQNLEFAVGEALVKGVPDDQDLALGGRQTFPFLALATARACGGHTRAGIGLARDGTKSTSPTSKSDGSLPGSFLLPSSTGTTVKATSSSR